jgi:hypothetical protein
MTDRTNAGIVRKRLVRGVSTLSVIRIPFAGYQNSARERRVT